MTGQAGGPCPDGLLCAIALDPTSLPRNRFYWVYSEPRARRAHGRAYALRRLHAQLMPILTGDAGACSVAQQERGLRIAYRDDAMGLLRRVHLSRLEASILKLLLGRDGLAVPPLLRVTSQDRHIVAVALQTIRSYPGLPDPCGWEFVLAPIGPGAPPSNTTE